MSPQPDEFPSSVGGGRVGLVGDTHANSGWFTRVINEMADDGIKVIVQLGDFGWWPHLSFISDVSRAAKRAGVVVLFIDGNHENHPHLRSTAINADPDSYHAARPVRVHPHLWHLPRGCAWEWNKVCFRGLGGAVSVDQRLRVPGVSWFAEEVPSEEDFQRAIDGGPADVLLTHDYPALGQSLTGMPGVPADLERSSREVRDRLADVVRAINPRLVVHGHWHQRYSTERHGVQVEGLSCDTSRHAAGVLNLGTLTVEEWPRPTRT